MKKIIFNWTLFISFIILFLTQNVHSKIIDTSDEDKSNTYNTLVYVKHNYQNCNSNSYKAFINYKISIIHSLIIKYRNTFKYITIENDMSSFAKTKKSSYVYSLKCSNNQTILFSYLTPALKNYVCSMKDISHCEPINTPSPYRKGSLNPNINNSKNNGSFNNGNSRNNGSFNNGNGKNLIIEKDSIFDDSLSSSPQNEAFNNNNDEPISYNYSGDVVITPNNNNSFHSKENTTKDALSTTDKPENNIKSNVTDTNTNSNTTNVSKPDNTPSPTTSPNTETNSNPIENNSTQALPPIVLSRLQNEPNGVTESKILSLINIFTFSLIILFIFY